MRTPAPCWRTEVCSVGVETTAGQLGVANTVNSPVDTERRVDLGGPALSIAAGGIQAAQSSPAPISWCVGDGADGKLGYGNTSNIGDDETPRSVGPVPLF